MTYVELYQLDCALEAQFLHDSHKANHELSYEQDDHILSYPVIVFTRIKISEFLWCVVFFCVRVSFGMGMTKFRGGSKTLTFSSAAHCKQSQNFLSFIPYPCRMFSTSCSVLIASVWMKGMFGNCLNFLGRTIFFRQQQTHFTKTSSPPSLFIEFHMITVQ